MEDDKILLELDNKSFNILISKITRDEIKTTKANEERMVVLYENLKSFLKKSVDEVFQEKAKNSAYIISYIDKKTEQSILLKDAK